MGMVKQEEATHQDGEAKCSFHPKNPPPAEKETAHERPSETFFPRHYFDYMFGTSTGGLIAILLVV